MSIDIGPRIYAALLCCIFAGCGSGSPYDYVKASGKITYDDGTPLPANNLKLRFVAQDPPIVSGAHPRAAFAVVDAEGKFDCVTSYKYGDGLIPGRHRVSVEREGLPSEKIPVSLEYMASSTTPIEVDTADAPFEIKVPRPKGGR